MNIGLLLFPRLTQLDLTGPHEVFWRIPGASVHVIAESLAVVSSESGLLLQPTDTFESAPPLDVICVPGGQGINQALEDKALLDYLSAQAAHARYVTSVCTGALILGAAGLLSGYRATTHWLSLDLLPLVRAEPVRARVVADRSRITSAGVTAGIDLALTLAALLHTPELASEIELMLEYVAVPAASGSLEAANPELARALTQKRQALHDERAAMLQRRSRTFT